MFVHLIGVPGSGKGTFSRLLQKVVGRDNYRGCKVSQMADGSTMAGIVNKQLVVCPDERAVSGVDTILSLTGGDAISYREVYKPASDAFFKGLLLVASNNPIFVGDTTGLDRRLCLVNFDVPVLTEARTPELEAAMESEIAQLIAVTLSLPDVTVVENIRGIGGSQIAEFKAREWDMKCQTNSVAAHFDDYLVVDATASISTGELYESYKDWCEESGLKPVSIVKYPRMLIDLLTDLRFDAVRNQKSRGRSTFEGLRLRTKSDTALTQSEKMTGVDGSLTGVMREFKSLPVGNCSDLTGVDSKNILEKSEIETVIESGAKAAEQEMDKKLEKVEKPPQLPSTPASSQLASDTPAAPTPVKLPSTPVNPRKVADAVEAVRLATTWADVVTAWGNDDELRQQIKAALPAEEVKRIGNLQAVAVKTPGTRVRYVGTDAILRSHYGGVELVVAEVDYCKSLGLTEITCTKPDGGYTTRISAKDLRAL